MVNRDFKELLAVFSAHSVRFLIVGGYAVTFHSRPRFTKDIDVWVDPEPGNARRVFTALAAFGAPLAAHGVTEHDFARHGVVYQLGVPPSRIDILTAAEGLQFAPCFARRVEASYGGSPVCYLAREDLIINKRTVGRPQDLEDVRALERGD